MNGTNHAFPYAPQQPSPYPDWDSHASAVSSDARIHVTCVPLFSSPRMMGSPSMAAAR